MRLYIIRHADPDYPNNTITAKGHLEAQALSVRLVAQGLDKVFTSPLNRARETMKYTTDKLGMDYTIEEWARELDMWLHESPWGPMAVWDAPGADMRESLRNSGKELWSGNQHFSAIKIDEVYQQVKKDSDAFLKRLGYEREGGRYRILNTNRDKVALFCHNGLGLTWLAHLLDLPLSLVWSGFWLPPSSVTTLLFDERSREWATPRCIGLGDVSHLYQAGLPVQPRGILANFD